MFASSLGVHRIPRRSDLVAHSPDRHDRRGVAELAAELANVDVDRAGVSGEGVTPDTLEQLIAREHETAVIQQLPKKIELLRRKLDLLVADARLAAAGIDVEISLGDVCGVWSLCGRGAHP